MKQLMKQPSAVKKIKMLLASLPRSTSRSQDDASLRPRLIWAQLLIYGLLGSISVATLYLFVTDIDEVTVVTGELKPLGNVLDVRSLVPGKVNKVQVVEGGLVKKGQVILQLDPTLTSSKQEQLNKQIQFLSDKGIDAEQSYQQRLKGLKLEVMSLRNSMRLQTEILRRLTPLQQQGAIQEVQVLEQQFRVQNLRTQIEQAISRIGELTAEHQKERQDNLTSLAELQKQLLEGKQLLNYQLIRAPIEGRIFDLKPNSPGYVVSEGELVFKVVPSSKLEAKVLLTNRDIGFAKVGQEAEVRVDAYPYTEFGSIPGKVKSISRDSLPADEKIPVPRFPAVITLDKQKLERSGRSYQLQSGQSVNVQLFLRRKRLATLLTDVLDRAIDSLSSVRGIRN